MSDADYRSLDTDRIVDDAEPLPIDAPTLQGMRLRAYLERKFPGMTPRDISQRHPSIVAGTLYAVMAGKRRPSAKLLETYRKELGVNPQWVRYGNDRKEEMLQLMAEADDYESQVEEEKRSYRENNKLLSRLKAATTGPDSDPNLVDLANKLLEEHRLIELYRRAPPSVRKFILDGLERAVDD